MSPFFYFSLPTVIWGVTLDYLIRANETYTHTLGFFDYDYQP